MGGLTSSTASRSSGERLECMATPTIQDFRVQNFALLNARFHCDLKITEQAK